MLMKLRSQMQRKDNQKGFTLVELMVVVVIIGILIAIAVPIYRNIQTNAQANACKANIRTIQGVLEVYKADGHSAYPANLNDLVNALVPYYIKAVPKCPGGTADYTYTLTSDTYTLTCPNTALGHND